VTYWRGITFICKTYLLKQGFFNNLVSIKEYFLFYSYFLFIRKIHFILIDL